MTDKGQHSNKRNHDQGTGALNMEEILQQLPLNLALAWGLEKEPQRGPKRELSIRQIVDTAIRIADQEGLAAVSMNRVARSLGYTAMSLYRYVPNKDALLFLMQDAVWELSIPPLEQVSDWREDMRTYMQACAQNFIKHPWYVDLPHIHEPVTPNLLKLLNWMLRSMRDFPLNDDEKFSIVILLSSYSLAWGAIYKHYVDLAGGNKNEASPAYQEDMIASFIQLINKEQYPYLYPLVQSGTYSMIFVNEDEDEDEGDNSFGELYHFGVERILDGIEQFIESKQA